MRTEEKLVWLGIKRNAEKVNVLQADINHLTDTVGTWSDFQTLVSNSADYTALRDTLVNTHSWTENDADTFITRLQNQFTDYSGFSSAVSGDGSYADFKARFDRSSDLVADRKTGTTRPALGVRLHETAGTSYSGVSVPAGTTEIYGSRIEFSEQDPVRNQSPSPVTYGTLATDDTDNVVNVFDSITFNVDVSNPNDFVRDVDVPLTEDGTVIRSRVVTIPANDVVNVPFTVTKTSYICADYAIGKSDSVLACWKPVGIIP